MFINENFTFNGIRSETLGVSIATLNDTNMFYDMGVEYTSNVSIEKDITDYNPYFTESFETPREIEISLLLYDPFKMEALSVEEYNIEDIYDWLITDDFAPFISDDDPDLIYYFKVIKIQKHLTYNGTGFLNVTFLPFSKYCYKREEYEIRVNGKETLEIFNPSRQDYFPIIELTNLGYNSTVNKINNLETVGVSYTETIIIDNLTKIVQSKDGMNRFSCCNRNWISFKKRENNVLVLEGNMNVKIICEYPIVK